MTTFVGQTGSTWATEAGIDGTNDKGSTKYLAAGYVAANSGAMAFARIMVHTVGSATRARVYVYQGVGQGATLVAMSAEINVTSVGLQSAAIAGNIVAGQKYTIVLQRNTGSMQDTIQQGSPNNVINQNVATNFPYGVPPATLPKPDTKASGQEFLVYIDGAYSLVCAPGSFSYAGQGAVLAARAQQNLTLVCLPGYFDYSAAQSHSDFVLDAATGITSYGASAAQGGKTTAAGAPGSGQGDLIPYWPFVPPAPSRRP